MRLRPPPDGNCRSGANGTFHVQRACVLRVSTAHLFPHKSVLATVRNLFRRGAGSNLSADFRRTGKTAKRRVLLPSGATCKANGSKRQVLFHLRKNGATPFKNRQSQRHNSADRCRRCKQFDKVFVNVLSFLCRGQCQQSSTSANKKSTAFSPCFLKKNKNFETSGNFFPCRRNLQNTGFVQRSYIVQGKSSVRLFSRVKPSCICNRAVRNLFRYCTGSLLSWHSCNSFCCFGVNWVWRFCNTK